MERKEDDLISVIRGPSLKDAVRAIHELADLRYPEAEHPEALLIDDADPAIATTAIYSMEGAEASWAATPLIQVLSGSDIRTKAWAAGAIDKLRPPFPDIHRVRLALESAASSADREVRAGVASALGELRMKDSLVLLKRMSFDEDEGVRFLADEALAKLESP